MRWYCRYGIRCRERNEMLTERRVHVDHTTLYRGSSVTRPRSRNAYAGLGVIPNAAGGSMRRTRLTGAGLTCTAWPVMKAARSASTCRPLAQPQRRSVAWARLSRVAKTGGVLSVINTGKAASDGSPSDIQAGKPLLRCPALCAALRMLCNRATGWPPA